MLTKKFKDEVKLSKIPAYRLAWAASLHPNTLSKYLSGYLKPKENDLRLLKIGEMLGLTSDQIFERDCHE